jgi:hypothetical protein
VYIAQVIAWTTPAYLLAANAGNAGFTKPMKALVFVLWLVVELSIFLTFWIGYSPVFFNPQISQGWIPTQIAALVFITLDFGAVLALMVTTICTQVCNGKRGWVFAGFISPCCFFFRLQLRWTQLDEFPAFP